MVNQFARHTAFERSISNNDITKICTLKDEAIYEREGTPIDTVDQSLSKLVYFGSPLQGGKFEKEKYNYVREKLG